MLNGQMTAMMMIECVEIWKASMDPLCVVWRTSSEPLKLLNLENLMKLVSWLEPHIYVLPGHFKYAFSQSTTNVQAH